MRLRNFFILLTIILMVCPAGRAAAQAVYGNTVIRGLDINNLNSTRGSNALSRFRRYSSGADRFSQQLTRSQPNPLAFNNQFSMGIPSGAFPQAPRPPAASRTVMRGIDNRTATYQVGTRLSSMIGNTSAFQSTTNVATTGTIIGAGRGIASVRGFTKGRSLAGIRDFSMRTGLRYSSPMPILSRRYPLAAVSGRKPANMLSSYSMRSFTQDASIFSRNAPNNKKTLSAERNTILDLDLRQQRIGRGILGTNQPSFLGRTSSFSLGWSRY